MGGQFIKCRRIGENSGNFLYQNNLQALIHIIALSHMSRSKLRKKAHFTTKTFKKFFHLLSPSQDQENPPSPLGVPQLSEYQSTLHPIRTA
jgi:hypothetical protein